MLRCINAQQIFGRKGQAPNLARGDLHGLRGRRIGKAGKVPSTERMPDVRKGSNDAVFEDIDTPAALVGLIRSE